LQSNPGTSVTVHGWVRTKRDTKECSFIVVNDGSSAENMQLVVDLNQHAELSGILDQLHTGASLKATGIMVQSPGEAQNMELQVAELSIYGIADPATYPLQKKRHSFEFLRDIAHLRPRTNTFSAVMRLRNVLSKSIHDFFQEQGFLWMHTPIITASDCEGAGQMFQVTTLDLSRTQAPVDYARDFFGSKAHLTVSGQLNGEMMATALGRIYTFGPTFRAENSNTTRHLAEFWMVEPECAFIDIHGNMDLAESFLKFVIRQALTHAADDLDFFNERIQPGLIDSLSSLLDNPFTRISYTQALDDITASGKKFEFPVHWGSDLQSEHEKFLTEELYQRPVIVTDYPKDIKAFYMKCNADNKTVRAMDVLVPRLGEIIGGSEREERLDVLLSRMKDFNLDAAEYWWYLDSRRFGTVPHAGFGLGFERLVQYVSGMQNIRDVIPFPRTPNNASF